MLKGFFSAIFSAGVSFAMSAIPAYAADDIEAKVQLCAACHGENGVPADPRTIPIIWGQQQSYLVKQLHDYRSGDRDNPIMSPIAKGLAQEDLRKIAAYFAAKPWPQHAPAVGATPPNGQNMTRWCDRRFDADMAAFKVLYDLKKRQPYLDDAIGRKGVCARRESNPRPTGSKPVALSI